MKLTRREEILIRFLFGLVTVMGITYVLVILWSRSPLTEFWFLSVFAAILSARRAVLGRY